MGERMASLHPANLRAVGIGQFLETLNDEELVSAMGQASAILRKRERARSDEFRKRVRDLVEKPAKDIVPGGRP